MKKFVFVYYGAWENPTQEMKDAWGKWFATIGDKIVDGGNPLGPGREISRSGTKELPLGRESIAGYSIISAANLDDAEKIAKSCPMVTSVRIYEAMSM